MTTEKSSNPPRWALRFLRWFCPDRLAEGIEGDLFEAFDQDVLESGITKARRKFVWNVFRFFRTGIFLRNKFSLDTLTPIMLRSYITVAIRNMSRRKLYAFINAFGLSIGLAFCILIYLFILDDRSFDQFHENKDRLYRVHFRSFEHDAYVRGEKSPYTSHGSSQAAMGEVMQDEIPEVEYMTRFKDGQGVGRYKEKVFTQNFVFVDSGFFKMFTFPLIAGSAERLFTRPSDIVMTREMAERYFGSDDPIGKSLTLESEGVHNFTVAAIIEAPPANSSITFSMLVPIYNYPRLAKARAQWQDFSYPTFVQLRPKANFKTFNAHFAALNEKYMGTIYKRWREVTKMPANFMIAGVGVNKITDIHLNKDIEWERSSDPQYSFILGGVALLILVIACINYVSLALTTSASRRIEVGIRKVIGAQRKQLVYQFSVESCILGFISMVLGLVMAVLFLPSFNQFTDKAISLTPVIAFQTIGASLLLTFFVGLFAGPYPGFFISAFAPAKVLKGGFASKVSAGFTKPLVIVQFALSAFLIISAVIMYRQMNFITTKDLGYDKEQILVINTAAGYSEEADKVVERFKNKAAGNPAIARVAGTSVSFNHGWSRWGYKFKDEAKSSYVYNADHDYLSLLGVEFVAGRNFDPAVASDSTGIIVNEALVKDLGWKDPINEHLNWRGDSLSLGSKIVGVVKDYNFLSLENEVGPMLISLNGKGRGHLTTLLVRITPGDVPNKVETVKKMWLSINPDKPFDYSFLDQDVARQYQKYSRWMNIMALSTGFAILIACLGLFGLAGINAVNRTKEVGIRKVMGADLVNIFVLMNKQYLWLALIAFVIATPGSWYVMTKWYLADFQYKITVGWELFAFSMLTGLTLALMTVSYHAIKVSLTNPAETLKYE